MAYQLGLDAKLYYSLTGIGGTPTWVEIDDAEEVTLNIEPNEATIKNRASGWEKSLRGQKVASIEFTVTQNLGGTAYEALRDAHISGDDIALAVASGGIATSGTEFFMMDSVLFGWSQSEPLEEAKTVAITAKPSALSDDDPSHAETV